MKRFLSTFAQRRRRDCWRYWPLWLVIWENFGLLWVHILYLFSTSISCVLLVSLLFTFRLGLSLVKWRLESLIKASRSVPFLLLSFVSNLFHFIITAQGKSLVWQYVREYILLRTALSPSLVKFSLVISQASSFFPFMYYASSDCLSRIPLASSFGSTTQFPIFNGNKDSPILQTSTATTWGARSMYPILYLTFLCLGHSCCASPIWFYRN
jgi:hypothetical protein